MWRHNSSITLNGQAISNLESLTTGPQKRSWADIEQAVGAGALKWHGNSVWEPGSRVYRPGAQVTDAERARDIQRALAILNESTRSLIARAHAIAEVPGFGLGTSTGLLMLTHPAEFALYNRQSIAALKRLKLPTQPLDAFEEAARRLRDELAVADFIELDLFLYRVANREWNGGKDPLTIEVPPTVDVSTVVEDANDGRSYWWVNQGSTYRQEKESACLWAPKTGKNNVTFGHWTNVFKVHPGDIVFHYANNQILAVSRVIEPPTEQRRPTALPSDAWEQDGYLARVSPYQELEPPIRRADIPHDWRVEETEPLAFCTGAGLGQRRSRLCSWQVRNQRWPAILPWLGLFEGGRGA